MYILSVISAADVINLAVINVRSHTFLFLILYLSNPNLPNLLKLFFINFLRSAHFSTPRVHFFLFTAQRVREYLYLSHNADHKTGLST